jgi:hypothetical protein
MAEKHPQNPSLDEKSKKYDDDDDQVRAFLINL